MWWSSDYGVKCYTGPHLLLVLLLAVPGLTLFSFGVPIASALLLRRAYARNQLDAEAFSSRYSFMYSDYRRRHFYFESVIMCRKLLMVGVGVVAGNRPVIVQIHCMLLIITLAGLIQAFLQPYKHTRYNQLESLSLGGTALSLWLCYFFMLSDIGQDERIVLSAALIGVNVAVIAYFGACIVSEAWAMVLDKMDRDGDRKLTAREVSAYLGNLVAEGRSRVSALLGRGRGGGAGGSRSNAVRSASAPQQAAGLDLMDVRADPTAVVKPPGAEGGKEQPASPSLVMPLSRQAAAGAAPEAAAGAGVAAAAAAAAADGTSGVAGGELWAVSRPDSAPSVTDKGGGPAMLSMPEPGQGREGSSQSMLLLPASPSPRDRQPAPVSAAAADALARPLLGTAGSAAAPAPAPAVGTGAAGGYSRSSLDPQSGSSPRPMSPLSGGTGGAAAAATAAASGRRTTASLIAGARASPLARAIAASSVSGAASPAAVAAAAAATTSAMRPPSASATGEEPLSARRQGSDSGDPFDANDGEGIPGAPLLAPGGASPRHGGKTAPLHKLLRGQAAMADGSFGGHSVASTSNILPVLDKEELDASGPGGGSSFSRRSSGVFANLAAVAPLPPPAGAATAADGVSSSSRSRRSVGSIGAAGTTLLMPPESGRVGGAGGVSVAVATAPAPFDVSPPGSVSGRTAVTRGGSGGRDGAVAMRAASSRSGSSSDEPAAGGSSGGDSDSARGGAERAGAGVGDGGGGRTRLRSGAGLAVMPDGPEDAKAVNALKPPSATQ